MNSLTKLKLLFVITALILMGCSSNDEKNRRILEINKTLEKQLEELNFYEMDDVHYFKGEIESSGTRKNRLEQMLHDKEKIQESYIKIHTYLSILKNQLAEKGNKDIDYLNNEISQKVKSLLVDLHSVVNNDNSRAYDENKKLFVVSDSIYTNKRNYLIQGDSLLNKAYLSKVDADLLLLKRMYSRLIDSYIIMESFYKPPADVYIFDNSKSIKCGQLYLAEIIWASNFFKGIGENLESVVIEEIKFENRTEELKQRCLKEDSIFSFKYLPKKPGIYEFQGFININQHGNYIWKIPFNRQFQIKE